MMNCRYELYIASSVYSDDDLTFIQSPEPVFTYLHEASRSHVRTMRYVVHDTSGVYFTREI